MDYRYGSHTVYNIEYHFVWVTKYRYKVLTGDVALRVREMVRQTCEFFEIKILQGVVSKDDVHILVSAPPHMAPSEIMRRIKGRTSSKLFEEFPMLKKRLRSPRRPLAAAQPHPTTCFSRFAHFYQGFKNL